MGGRPDRIGAGLAAGLGASPGVGESCPGSGAAGGPFMHPTPSLFFFFLFKGFFKLLFLFLFFFNPSSCAAGCERAAPPLRCASFPAGGRDPAHGGEGQVCGQRRPAALHSGRGLAAGVSERPRLRGVCHGHFICLGNAVVRAVVDVRCVCNFAVVLLKVLQTAPTEIPSNDRLNLKIFLVYTVSLGEHGSRIP